MLYFLGFLILVGIWFAFCMLIPDVGQDIGLTLYLWLNKKNDKNKKEKK